MPPSPQPNYQPYEQSSYQPSNELVVPPSYNQQPYAPAASQQAYGQPPHAAAVTGSNSQYVDVPGDGPEEEVTLQPFPTNNPFIQRVFKMKEFGRAPGRAIQVFRERVIDPEEKMIAAFKSKHGQYRWGYLVLTSHALRWFQTLPTRDEDLWSWDDVGLNGSVVVCQTWQYQLKGFGAGRKFKALMLVLAQAEGWERDHS